MSELTDFLLARIAEDEAVARDAATVPLVSDDEPWALEVDSGDRIYGATGCVIANPARVLAECAAKRAIIEWHQNWPVFVERPVEFEPSFGADESFPDQIAMRVSQQIAWLTQEEYRARFGDEPPSAPFLLHMAAVYADHPDYRSEWAL